LDERDDPHLRFTVRALQWVNFIDALYARSPTTLTKLLPIITLWFFSGRRGELGALTPAPTGLSSIVASTLAITSTDMV
jgi:hypothetical protein